MKHRTQASANLKRFIGAIALTAMIIPSVSVFAAQTAVDVLTTDKKEVGDRLQIVDFNNIIDVLTPLNVGVTGILTTESDLNVGGALDVTGATTTAALTASGLVTANSGLTILDGQNLTFDAQVMTDVETSAEWGDTEFGTLTSIDATTLDDSLMTAGWSVKFFQFQQDHLSIESFNGYKALGTPVTGDIMVWDATADGGNGSWVAQDSIPDLVIDGVADINGATTIASLTVEGTTEMDDDLTILNDNASPVTVLTFDNTDTTEELKLLQGTDFTIYSDGGTTDVFSVTGAGVVASASDMTVGGTLDVTTGATTLGGTLGVTGVVTADAGVVVDNTTFDANALTVSTGNFSVAVVDDTDIVLDTGGTGGVLLERIKLDSALITEVTLDTDTWATDSGKDTAIPTTKAVNTMLADAIGGGQSGNFTDLTVTGATALNGGLTMDTDKFTVADETGNTHIGGTLDVDGATNLDGTVTFSTMGVGVLQSDASGVVTSSSTITAALTVPGLTMTGAVAMGVNDISGTGDFSGTAVTASGTVTGGTFTDGTASITGGDITGVGDIDATTGTIDTFDSTAATINSLVLTASTAVTATSEGTTNNDKLTTQGYVDDAITDLATGFDLDPVTQGTCDDSHSGNMEYVVASNVGTFWGCVQTGESTYHWVALSIFED